MIFSIISDQNHLIVFFIFFNFSFFLLNCPWSFWPVSSFAFLTLRWKWWVLIKIRFIHFESLKLNSSFLCWFIQILFQGNFFSSWILWFEYFFNKSAINWNAISKFQFISFLCSNVAKYLFSIALGQLVKNLHLAPSPAFSSHTPFFCFNILLLVFQFLKKFEFFWQRPPIFKKVKFISILKPLIGRQLRIAWGQLGSIQTFQTFLICLFMFRLFQKIIQFNQLGFIFSLLFTFECFLHV